jgi:hypothetical protein
LTRLFDLRLVLAGCILCTLPLARNFHGLAEEAG